MKEISNKVTKPDVSDDALEKAYKSMREKLDSMGNLYNLPPEDMEDALQEGFLRLSSHGMDQSDQVKGKLWVTVRNLVIDSFRKRKPVVNLSEIEEEISSVVTPTFDIDYPAIRKQMKEILSPQQWKIMHLLVEEGMDYPEIAENLGMAEGAVRTHVSRARKLLREKMEF